MNKRIKPTRASAVFDNRKIGFTDASLTAGALVEELDPAPDVWNAFKRLARLPHCIFFDSARRDSLLGRYSFIAADPFEFIQLESGTNTWQTLAERLEHYRAVSLPGMPPFQGGAAGLLSYDLGRIDEKLPPAVTDEFQLPLVALGLYDVVVAFDHQQNRAWLFSQGFPENNPEKRIKRAVARLQQFRRGLEGPCEELSGDAKAKGSSHLPAERLALQHPVTGIPGLTSNFTSEGYRRAVARAIDYVRAGDVFQVNLSQRLLFLASDTSLALYERLRARNPATFAGYFDLGDFQIISSSPERFLRVRDREVEARPIKGTRRREVSSEADKLAREELLASEKDRAENVMIVDLLRNDLSRVCRSESVRVSQLCGLESSEYVHHLVSAVRGTLRDDCGPLDLLRAALPGGSVTGAPKIRAMEIIAELEPSARGAYCGALGYIGFDGSMDTSILIRTITAGRGWWQFPVGGGIVAQSNPETEHQETWHKAEGLLRALK